MADNSELTFECFFDNWLQGRELFDEKKKDKRYTMKRQKFSNLENERERAREREGLRRRTRPAGFAIHVHILPILAEQQFFFLMVIHLLVSGTNSPLTLSS